MNDEFTMNLWWTCNSLVEKDELVDELTDDDKLMDELVEQMNLLKNPPMMDEVVYEGWARRQKLMDELVDVDELTDGGWTCNEDELADELVNEEWVCILVISDLVCQ